MIHPTFRDGLTNVLSHFLIIDCFSSDIPYYSQGSGDRYQRDAGAKMRSMETLTRAEIAEAINRQLGLSRSESLAMVETILQHMTTALENGENVKISGFGTFLLRDKAERTGRNPKTGVEVPITPRRVLTFRASQLLKDRISGK